MLVRERGRAGGLAGVCEGWAGLIAFVPSSFFQWGLLSKRAVLAQILQGEGAESDGNRLYKSRVGWGCAEGLPLPKLLPRFAALAEGGWILPSLSHSATREMVVGVKELEKSFVTGCCER